MGERGERLRRIVGLASDRRWARTTIAEFGVRRRLFSQSIDEIGGELEDALRFAILSEFVS